MAEFLVRAKPHWKDSWDKKKVDSLTGKEKDNYEARTQIGDIIAVYPDGRCKEPPSPDSPFIIIKLPDIAVDPSKPIALTERTDGTLKVLKRRKFQVPEKTVSDYFNANEKEVTISSSLAKTEFISKIIEKTKDGTDTTIR